MNWNEVNNFMKKYGIPANWRSRLHDGLLTILYKRPVLNIFEMEKYLFSIYHEEMNGKSLSDVFKGFFGADYEKACYFFALKD